LQEFYHDAEKLGGSSIASVEPVKRLTMFLANATRHPNDNARFQASRICNELPEVSMVGFLKLILDDDAFVAAQVPGHYVYCKVADGVLLSRDFQIKAEHLPYQIYVFYQPWCEIQCFVFPDISKFNALQYSKLRRTHQDGLSCDVFLQSCLGFIPIPKDTLRRTAEEI